MFADEARIGAELNHPNVVQVLDVGEHDGAPFIVMEHIRGEELNQLCRRGLSLGRFLPLEQSVEIVRQAACALGYVHSHRDGGGRGFDLIHCDISPNNLLVTEDGFVKLIDFGIAQSSLQDRIDDGAVPGKLSYMSPEQARRERLDFRSDIFSLGVILYELTVGQRLFRGPAKDVLDRLLNLEVRPPTFVNPTFPGHLESIVLHCLESHPEDRYHSAFDLADELAEYLHESGARANSVTVARYLDDLAEASGGQRRPELIPESEWHEDGNVLDFDRRVFAEFVPVSDEAAAMADAWSEVEEGDIAVAEVLGIDVSLVRSSAAPADDPAAEDEIDALADAIASASGAEPSARSIAREVLAGGLAPTPALAGDVGAAVILDDLYLKRWALAGALVLLISLVAIVLISLCGAIYF
jgi:hypothetical protein